MLCIINLAASLCFFLSKLTLLQTNKLLRASNVVSTTCYLLMFLVDNFTSKRTFFAEFEHLFSLIISNSNFLLFLALHDTYPQTSLTISFDFAIGFSSLFFCLSASHHSSKDFHFISNSSINFIAIL